MSSTYIAGNISITLLEKRHCNGYAMNILVFLSSFRQKTVYLFLMYERGLFFSFSLSEIAFTYFTKDFLDRHKRGNFLLMFHAVLTLIGKFFFVVGDGDRKVVG